MLYEVITTQNDQVVFQIVASNIGENDDTNVQVSDLLPTGYSYSSYSATAGTYNPTTGIWNLGTLAVGESETLTVTVIINPTGDYSYNFV